MYSDSQQIYRDFLQRSEEIYRAPYEPEIGFYTAIKAGNTRKVKELCQESFVDKKGLGVLSTNSLQNMKYHYVIATAVIARHCIEGGLDMSEAYNISDYYILKVDQCQVISEINALHTDMCLTYTKTMRNLKKRQICSKPVTHCIDYIYDHLNTRIKLETLAQEVDLSCAYLSRLFKKETGMSVSDYILQKKIETAKSMLVFSDYPIASISSTLAFPSQSYFTQSFLRLVGETPREYRKHHYQTPESELGPDDDDEDF